MGGHLPSKPPGQGQEHTTCSLEEQLLVSGWPPGPAVLCHVEEDRVKFFPVQPMRHNCQGIEKQPLKLRLQGHLDFSSTHTGTGLLLSQSPSFLI